MSVGDILDRDEDRPAYVRFERRAVKDAAATLQAGHYVSRDEDYALITPPYSKDVIEKRVDSWLEQVEVNVKSGRIPVKHFDLWKEAYKRWQDGQEPPLDGTSVKDWSALSPAQCDNLIRAGCRTIEDLAQANDEAMRRLGMGGSDLKNKAKAWLQAAKDHGPLTMEIAELKSENAQLQGTIESLQDQIKLFEVRLDAQQGEVETAVIPGAWPKGTVWENERGFAGGINPPEVSSTIEFIPETTVTKQPSVEQQHTENLKTAYKDKFGRLPPGRMLDATILKHLKE